MNVVDPVEGHTGFWICCIPFLPEDLGINLAAKPHAQALQDIG